MDDEYASVRYIVDDVDAAVAFYTEQLGFTVLSRPAPPFADVVRGRLRVLLSAEESGPGRNRIHLVVDDFDEQVDRLRDAGVTLRSEVVEGPGGRQLLVADPAGNLVEVFEPAG